METVVQLENYDQMAITEKWWDESHNWTMTVMCYKLYRRRNWQGRRDGAVHAGLKHPAAPRGQPGRGLRAHVFVAH